METEGNIKLRLYKTPVPSASGTGHHPEFIRHQAVSSPSIKINQVRGDEECECFDPRECKDPFAGRIFGSRCSHVKGQKVRKVTLFLRGIKIIPGN